jgi:hypothetical protein
MKFPKIDIGMFIERTLVALKVRPEVGGLEISDTALKFASLSKGRIKTEILRLPPGIVDSGVVVNKEQFEEALRVLRSKILQKTKSRNKVNVIVSLSSARFYSQVFSLPLLESDNLEKAIALNMQMASPADSSKIYSDWQIINRDEKTGKIDVLTSFIDKDVVDGIIKSLDKSSFVTVALESKTLSLARLIRQKAAGFNEEASYVVVDVDSDGIDIFIIRKGDVYFEYNTSWKDMDIGRDSVTVEGLSEILIKNINQVLNFYSSHWHDKVQEVFLVTSNLGVELESIISANFGLKINSLRVDFGVDIGPDWFSVLGSGIRGLVLRREDTEISLSGVRSSDEFRREELIDFLRFWRMLITVSMGVLLATIVTANIMMMRLANSVEGSLARAPGEDFAEFNKLKNDSISFNYLVNSVRDAKLSVPFKSPVLEKVYDIASNQGITISKFSFRDFGIPVTLTGQTISNENILQFKKSLELDQSFESISLPLTDIRPTPTGFSFSVTFSIKDLNVD